MSTSILFWVVMLIWLLFGLWAHWPPPGSNPIKPVGQVIIVWFLLALLGWKVFGPAIHQ